MTVYGVLLIAHAYVRWGVAALAIAVLVRSVHGVARRRAFTRGDEQTHVAFVAAVDTQLLLGAGLYFHASPIVRAFFADPREAMKITALRFFGLEHATMMLAAVVLVHIGRVRSKRKDRHRRTAKWTLGALALMMVAIPWPFLRHGRPWLRDLPTTAPATATRCPSTYAARCAACHGDAGRGNGIAAAALSPRPRDFSDPKWWTVHTDADIANVIRDGGAKHGLSAAMPAQSDLAGGDVEQLVSCIRSLQRQGR